MSSLFGAWAITLPTFTRRSLSSLENSTSTHLLRYLFLISTSRISENFRFSFTMILHDQTLTEQGLSAVRQETVGYDASNPVEPSRIVGKNFLLDLRPEPFHRLELGNCVELAR